MASSNGEQVLVTGASGFIATHVIQRLQRAGYRVRGTVRSLKNETKVAPLRALCPEAEHPLELVEAELMEAAHWKTAVVGCKYVLHVASPVPTDVPEDDDLLIRQAVDGTLNVLKACQQAGGVRRVVITGSLSAIGDTRARGKVLTENDWTDDKKSSLWSYSKSKTRAEKAAWEFVENLPRDDKFELVVLNPGFVLGPLLCNYAASSSEVIRRIMKKEAPILPRVQFPCVCMHDVADAHVTAMTLPEAAGNRFMLTQKSLWMKEIAEVLKTEFAPQGYSVPTTNAPSWLLKLAGVFRKDARMLKPMLDLEYNTDNSKMINVLGIQPKHSVEEAIVDLTYSMIEKGLLPKTSKYTGKSSSK